ncbi:hypothetical protein K2Y11_21020 [bacterium]|nr:hypothetical protein [bacterium]
MSPSEEIIISTASNALRKHFLSVGMIYRFIDGNGNFTSEEKYACTTGFLINSGETHAIFTAGHTVKAVLDLKNHPHVRILNSGIIDYIKDDAPYEFAVPFRIDEENSSYAIDDESGIDFGKIVLRKNYIDNVKANEVVSIDAARWHLSNQPRFDRYFLFGIPAEKVTLSSVSGNPRMTAYTLLLDKIENNVEKSLERFQARIIDMGDINDISGVSGTQIIGANLGERGITYSLVGIETSWKKGSQIVIGQYMSTITQLLLAARLSDNG